MTMTDKQKEIRGKILNELYLRGPISRKDIARNTGITPATTTAITGELIKEGIIEANSLTDNDSKSKNRSGRKKVTLSITNYHSYYIGIELSRHFLTLCLINNAGEVITKQHHKVEILNFTNDEAINYLLAVLTNCLTYYQNLNIQAAGIAIPGHFDKQNQRIASSAEWQKFNLSRLINEAPVPLFLENNVHCMSLYEHLISTHNKGNNFVFFHAVQGIFLSSIYNESLYGVNNFSVGEIGHTIVYPNGERCECGRYGCLQNYLGGFNILKKAQHSYNHNQHSLLRGLVNISSDITLAKVAEAYRLGDTDITHIIEDAINAVVVTLNNLSMLIDTSKIYLHGPLFNDMITRHILTEYLSYKNLYQGLPDIDFDIIPYEVTNGARGAAILALSHSLIWSQ
ncbi:ROK family protein [Staphylococcus durrellii]|uniref:ROK family protein n=1 Tax=Staphylococcus durrellii TaxID=2781773 RepID=UPI00189C694B|nr:ROK family protein [Staphylococcus durrellii]MBF7016153.1 ROK family protein [Staphylococcus durrellii]